MNKSTEGKQLLPLLYIQQPSRKSPKAKMQSEFKFWDRREPIRRQKEPDMIEKDNIEGLEAKVVEAQEKKDKSAFENKQIKHEVGQEKDEEQYREMGIRNIVNEDNQPKFIGNHSVVRDTDCVQPTKKRVPFNDQGFEDKLWYLSAIPMEMVRIRFEFITTDGKYTAYFLSNNDNILEILTVGGKETISLPLHSIIDIRMIGI